MAEKNPFGSLAHFQSKAGRFAYHRLAALERYGSLERLPYSIRVLLESCLRNYDGFVVGERDVTQLAAWQADSVGECEIPFKPGRVILQDFTGVPAVVDLADRKSVV